MSKNIDWDYWQKLPEIKAFEAIALLHGAEPESEPPDDASPEYRKTLRLLLACLSDRSFFTPSTLIMGDPALHGVKLAEVGRWALTNGYKVPEGFPQLEATTRKPTIDWPFWKAMRTVKLWQACALIAGLDPDKLRQHPQAWMAGPGSGPVFDNKSFSSLDNKTRFEKALRLAESAVSYMDGPIYPKGQPHPGNNKEKDVLLSEVAAYFRSIEWVDIPAALQSIAVQETGPAQTATTAPLEANSASGATTGPLPLTTSDIAFCFADLRWGEREWKKPLGDKPKWLEACVHTPGTRGVSETRWNPVLIGAALVRDGHAKVNSIRSRFQTKPLLKPWLDVWKTYEADNLTTN